MQAVALTTESDKLGTLSRWLSSAWERGLASVSGSASGWGECGDRGSGGGPGAWDTRGLPLAIRAVSVGHEVVGYDTDAVRVKRLEAGESYVEDVSSCELAAALNSGRFRLSSNADDCTGFDIAVITAPTPLRDGLPDLAFIEAASRTLARYLRPGSTVILESTSFPGTTTQTQVLTWLEEGSGLAAGTDFRLGYSPERIDPGNGSWTLVATPKIVSGIDDDSLTAVERFYQGWWTGRSRCPPRVGRNWPT